MYITARLVSGKLERDILWQQLSIVVFRFAVSDFVQHAAEIFIGFDVIRFAGFNE
jgi:hypothetical protein